MTFKEEIEKILGSEGIAKIKAALKFSQEPIAQPVTIEVKLVDVPLVDGTVLSVDKMEVGGTANLVTPEGSNPAPDGEYTAADGTIITVMGGLIAEVSSAAEAAGETETPVAPAAEAPMSEMAQVLERLAALEAKLASNQTMMSEMKSNLAVSLEAIDKIVTIPVAMSLENQKPKSKSFEEMTALEKYRYFKHNG